jgi:hypothetical protein
MIPEYGCHGIQKPLFIDPGWIHSFIEGRLFRMAYAAKFRE